MSATMKEKNVDRKTSTILSQDNYRSQKIMHDLSKLPLKVVNNPKYQEQIQKTLNGRHSGQSVSVMALHHMNQSSQTYYGESSAKNIIANKNMIKNMSSKNIGSVKMAGGYQRGGNHQFDGDIVESARHSSASTDKRYLSAKSNQKPSQQHLIIPQRMPGAAVSRNIPLNTNSRTHTFQKINDFQASASHYKTTADRGSAKDAEQLHQLKGLHSRNSEAVEVRGLTNLIAHDKYY